MRVSAHEEARAGRIRERDEIIVFRVASKPTGPRKTTVAEIRAATSTYDIVVSSSIRKTSVSATRQMCFSPMCDE